MREHPSDGSQPVKGAGKSAATVARTQRTSRSDNEVAPAVIADDIALSAAEGRVFGHLSFTVPGSGLTVLSGRGGSGRTSLALSISGRMKLDAGSLTVLGEDNPNKINKMVAIAGVEQIDGLDGDVRLKTVLMEHKSWSNPWIKWTKRSDQSYYESLCGEVFGDRELPPLDSYVAELSSLDNILIRISLALAPANSHEIRMLVMDDLEQVREYDLRLILIDVLSRLAQRMPVIVNTVNPIPDELMPDYTLIELFNTMNDDPGPIAEELPPETQDFRKHRFIGDSGQIAGGLAADSSHVSDETQPMIKIEDTDNEKTTSVSAAGSNEETK